MQTILVIDNDELELNQFATILKREGYNVLLTADGPAGIQIYKNQRPTLVIVDKQLPSMSGIEVMNAIQEFDDKARVIMMQ